MAHNIESMFYTREKPWHGLGTMVQEAPTSSEALRLAGLDWTVDGRPIYTAEGEQIDNYKVNVRSSDNAVLGVVTDRYTICQNSNAFEFTDELIGGDVRYETAGSLRGGRRIWLLAKMPNTTVAGDDVEPYLCFTNTHDGTGAVRVCMTPVRVVCNNTLNIALSCAKRSWSVTHVGDIQEKITEAKIALELAGEYMDALDKRANMLANTSLPFDKVREIINELFPINEDDGERAKATMKKTRDAYYVSYFMPDLKQFQGTAWGAINAMADMVDHNAPHRKTKNYAENNWGRIMDGHVLVDQMTALCTK